MLRVLQTYRMTCNVWQLICSRWFLYTCQYFATEVLAVQDCSTSGPWTNQAFCAFTTAVGKPPARCDPDTETGPQ